ncbi:hypothetical protein MFUR16E_29260 [Methylobacterium fujisawaense]|uniref:hypothetical protein n=1 Tax=Methylobacterium fujisawaense TaxID=107400 RepID=UPI002F315DDE
MSAVRSHWRSLLTVFQIVALVAFSVAGVGHSHAGGTHAGHSVVSAVGHTETVISDLAGDVADRAGDDATSDCGLCCCHASFGRWDASAATVTWKPGRTLAGIRAVAFKSVASERLPEPPRTIA